MSAFTLRDKDGNWSLLVEGDPSTNDVVFVLSRRDSRGEVYFTFDAAVLLAAVEFYSRISDDVLVTRYDPGDFSSL